MTRIQDITGQKFGRLTAKEYMFTDKGKSSTWLCQCECGNTLSVVLSTLRNGSTQSCGCLRLESLRKKNTTHNKSHTSEYYAWGNMVQRCTNPKSPEYKNYGGRGISVCAEWKNSFQNFLDDMGEKPKKSYSLDRVDNEADYDKENCRWTDFSTQAINRRDLKNETTGIRNISHSKRDDLFYVSIDRKGKRYRKAFKELQAAVAWKEETLISLRDKHD